MLTVVATQHPADIPPADLPPPDERPDPDNYPNPMPDPDLGHVPPDTPPPPRPGEPIRLLRATDPSPCKTG
ncbi:hypothetical protein [Yoonia vestfoldensis]|uniref:hypothetical protein n=1 Tax=Yoonia vestfoldensis TaxID=245188 RepID=UPI0009D922CF|nr:hypothetical protein [Yoonia vestfoldensis]